jgi:opacity protein-like surface antigen
MRIRLRPIVGESVLVIACSAAAAAPASAQRIEASVNGGGTLSEGFNATQPRIVFGQVFNSLDITSGTSLAVTAGVFVTAGLEVEFLWGRQFSTFQASNPAPNFKIANVDVDNFHGNIVYNWGESDARVRPFAFGGLGATHYSPGDFSSSIPNIAGLPRIQSRTKFSSTWGGGVKFYPTPRVGVRGTMRWTPTYIKTDGAGWFCDPFYGTCWVVGDADYSNQLEFTGGVTFRFGGHF